MIRGFFNVYMPLLVCVSIWLVIEEYRANWIYHSVMALGRNVFDPNSFLDTEIRLGPRHNEKSFPTMVTQITRSILFTGKTSTYTLACTFYREKFFLPSHISHITSTPAHTFLGGKFHLPSHSRTFSLPRTCSPAKEISLAESNFQYWTWSFEAEYFLLLDSW